MTTKHLLFLATTGLGLFGTTAAMAQDIETQRGTTKPPTDITELSTQTKRDFVANPTGVSLGGMLGNGFSDSYGIGIGAKGGYTFPNRVYVGGNINYHWGSSQEVLGNTSDTTTWYFGPEVGYDLGVGPVILRPVIGAGLGFATENIRGPLVSNTSDTTTTAYVAPGASVHYPIGNFFLGGDTRIMVMSGGVPTAWTLFGTGGVHL